MAQTSVEAGSVTNAVAEHIAAKEADQRDKRQQTQKLARELLVRMSDGEPYTIRDFLFVATHGRLAEHEAEAETLEALAGLQPSKIVGVTLDGKLTNVGITTDPPFTMRAQASPSEGSTGQQHNRSLTAVLNFSVAARQASRFPTLYAEMSSEQRLSVEVLRAWGEPGDIMWSDGSVFYEPQQVIVGSEAVIHHLVASQDELGGQQLALLLDNLVTPNQVD